MTQIRSARWAVFGSLLLFFALGLGACSKIKVPEDIQIFGTLEDQSARVRALHTTTQSIEVEVIYEEGAAPFTGQIKDYPLIGLGAGKALQMFKDEELWQITRHNIVELFAHRLSENKVQVPVSLSEMQSIPAINQSSYSLLEIEHLANQHRKARSSGTHASLVVLFLNGKFRDESGTVSNSVIGVSLSGSDITAVFKPMILSSGSTRAVQAFSEQTTVVHELGHAVGLVANGMPMVGSDHKDHSNGHHCSNDQCVMYYAASGAEGLRNFVNSNLKELSTLMLWDSACMDDVRYYK